ncbi:ROK family protein, partial [Nocardioides sp. NPDC000441]
MPEMTTAADVLALVRSGRALTRSDLQKTTGLSRTAVVSRVSALVDAGLILTGEELASTGGRPPGSLTFNADAGVVLAVAIGRSRSQLAVFDLDGRELAGDTRDHEVGIAADDLMPDVTDRLERLLEGIEPPVLGVGMSLPGVVDPVRLVSVDSPVMRGWDGVALDPYFDRLTDGPLVLVNDTDALATAELFGSGLNPRDALVVKASTGLGLAVIADGRVLRGHAGAVGEIGHTRVESAGERPCRCGAT